MKTIRHQLKAVNSLDSFISPNEDIKLNFYPEYVVPLQKQTRKTDEKKSIYFCKKTVLKPLNFILFRTNYDMINCVFFEVMCFTCASNNVKGVL